MRKRTPCLDNFPGRVQNLISSGKNMKKIRIATGVTAAAFLVLIVFGVTMAHASRLHQEDGIFTNHSAEFVRTLNRNTSTDPDAAFYNPAGLAFMKEKGLYVSFNTQTLYAKRAHTMDYYAVSVSAQAPTATQVSQSWFKDCLPDEYSAELTAPVLPSFDVVWKDRDWAVFFDMSVMQAATDMTFPQGLAVMDWGNLATKEVSLAYQSANRLEEYNRNAIAVRNEMYLGFTLGGAYRVLDWLSAGGGLRYISANGNMKIKMDNIRYVMNGSLEYPDESVWDIDTDTEGHGFGLIASSHFKPGRLVSYLKGLDATIRAEYYLPMALKKKTNSFLVPSTLEASGALDIFKDGSPGKQMTYLAPGNGNSELKVTYAPSLHMGLAYTFLDRIKVETSAELSFRQLRDLDGREDDYTFGYRVGAGIEYKLLPQVVVSAGYLYNNFGIKPEKRNEADTLLRNHQIGGGMGMRVTDRLDVNIGAFYVAYVPVTIYTTEHTNVGSDATHYLKKKFDEKRFSIAFGVTYRFLGGGDALDGNQVKLVP